MKTIRDFKCQISPDNGGDLELVERPGPDSKGYVHFSKNLLCADAARILGILTRKPVTIRISSKPFPGSFLATTGWSVNSQGYTACNSASIYPEGTMPVAINDTTPIFNLKKGGIALYVNLDQAIQELVDAPITDGLVIVGYIGLKPKRKS